MTTLEEKELIEICHTEETKQKTHTGEAASVPQAASRQRWVPQHVAHTASSLAG
jgi:hypothetical protein